MVAMAKLAVLVVTPCVQLPVVGLEDGQTSVRDPEIVDGDTIAMAYSVWLPELSKRSFTPDEQLVVV